MAASELVDSRASSTTSRRIVSNTPPLNLKLDTVIETHKATLVYSKNRKKQLNNYEILSDIGRGQHGRVKLARNVDTDEHVAIKVVDKTSRPRLGKSVEKGMTQWDKIQKEIKILDMCKHPNVVTLIEIINDERFRKIYLIMEYLPNGQIKWQRDEYNSDINSMRPLLTMSESKKYFRDVLLGLDYLHSKGIIHRDIKPANLLLDSENTVKITDFGVSYLRGPGSNESELSRTAGSPAFFAPEICYTDLDKPREKITEQIDVWALGVTLYCFVFGRLPYIGDNEFGLFVSIVNQPLKFPTRTEPNNDIEDAKDLISKMLIKDPTKRIRIPDIRKHNFILRGLNENEKVVFVGEPNSRIKNDSKKLNTIHNNPSTVSINATSSSTSSKNRKPMLKVKTSLLKAFGLHPKKTHRAPSPTIMITHKAENFEPVVKNIKVPQTVPVPTHEFKEAKKHPAVSSMLDLKPPTAPFRGLTTSNSSLNLHGLLKSSESESLNSAVDMTSSPGHSLFLDRSPSIKEINELDRSSTLSTDDFNLNDVDRRRY